MTTVSSTTLRNNLSSAIDSITKRENFMLITNRGSVNSALVDIDLFEDLLTSADSEYLDSVKKARKEVNEGDVFTHAEVFGDL